MTLWAVGSVHGSPGATTLALALTAAWPRTWSRPTFTVEADPNGGILAARFDDRLRLDKTLDDLAAHARHGWDSNACLGCARAVWPDTSAVVALPSAELVHRTLSARGAQLAATLAGADADVIVDVGRIDPRSPALPLAQRAVLTLLVTVDGFDDFTLTRARVEELRRLDVVPGIVVVAGPAGGGPHSPPLEFAAAVGAPLIAALPTDSVAAGLFGGRACGRRRLERSLWWRTVREIASELAARTTTPPLSPQIDAPGGVERSLRPPPPDDVTSELSVAPTSGEAS